MRGSDDTQKLMYRSEHEENFRWVAKLIASRSSRVLTVDDLASPDIESEFEQIGQFAEIASNNTVPISFILDNIDQLVEPHFPLEGYRALKGGLLVADFFGRVADLHAYAVYRPSTKQLIVAISGTTGPIQAIQDLRFLFTPHPSGRGRVHTGFWTLYNGLKDLLFDAISKGLQQHDVQELVLTGHSMGGAISYLLALDLLTGPIDLPSHLKVVSYGSPRTGDRKFVKYWRECAASFRQTRTLTELCVKGYNDGVHALPPYFVGYRHITEDCFYLVYGRLFRVPSSECEASLFTVPPSADAPLHPKGGHNYYNGHDMEKVLRRLKLVNVALKDWIEVYLAAEDAFQKAVDTLLRSDSRSMRIALVLVVFAAFLYQLCS